MLDRLGLSSKLYLGFGTVLALFLGLAAFLHQKLQSVAVLEKAINVDCIPGIVAIGALLSVSRENYELLPEHINAKDAAGKAAVEAEMLKQRAVINGAMEEYEKSITLPEDRALFEKLTPLRKRYVQIRETMVQEPSRAGRVQEANENFSAKLRPAFKEYLDAIETLSKWNADNAKKAGGEIKSAVGASESALWTGLAVAAALAAAIGIMLSRSISKALGRMIESLTSGSRQISSASGQVSQSSQSLAEGASEQASSLEETSASLEELSSMTKRNSDNARQANTMANEARGEAEGSRESMGRMCDAIGKIKQSADQTAKIIKTIDEIAFQTNLLALNAAVEAARAGDAGKGFAVVAEEVRNLAKRSADSAKSTAALIEQSQKNADEGVEVSTEVASILSGIVGKVQKLAQLIGEVSAASDEQAKGIEQIGTAVTQMDKVTQGNAASAEESASASEELFAQAKELGDMVVTLVGIVKGAGHASSSPGAQAEPGRAARKAVAGPSGYRAVPVHKTLPSTSRAQASKARPAPGTDWSPVRPAGRNGSRQPVAKAETIIPLGDDELKDF